MKILETPRDAIQGLKRYIPADNKIEVLNAILKCGFDIVDVGSFVSDKVIPQFGDMDYVLQNIEVDSSMSSLFVLVANEKGGERALSFDNVDFVGFPFSTSPVFLKKNINSSFEKAEKTIDALQNNCVKHGKQLFVYLSMAFGNPYGDEASPEIIYHFTEKLVLKGIKYISLSDIIGVAEPEFIREVYSVLTNEFENVHFGIHLHYKGGDWYEKIEAAFDSGCEIFDGVITGMGGCPMTGYEMLGNLPTGNLLKFAEGKGIELNINKKLFEAARDIAIKNWMFGDI